MSQLLILGNTNKYTFCNAVVAAQSRAKEYLHEELTDIFVIHSKESFHKLFSEETDWIDFLKKYDIEENAFINRVISIKDQEYTEFLAYIKGILKNCQMSKLIIDMSNGTSEMKTTLSIIAYLLDVSHVYFIDSISLAKGENTKIFLEENQLREYYKKVIHSKSIDELANINLTEIIRYKEKVNELSEIYKEFDKRYTNDAFFKDNLLHAILLKIKSDNSPVSDNALYRISSTAIASSLEDLIDKFLLDYGIFDIGHKTLGNKISILQNKIKETVSAEFDFKFLEMFNEFMLYLRNSTTHKNLTVSDSEKFKAALSVQMSLVFLEYYSKIVYKELKKAERIDGEVIINEILPNENEQRFFGLDGDNTGKAFESLLQSNKEERDIAKFSDKVRDARKAVVNYIEKSSKGKTILAEGDDILFKGYFSMDDLMKMKEIYYEKSGGMTCSIAYGKTFKEVLFSMKLAKTEKNSIKGISITNSK